MVCRLKLIFFSTKDMFLLPVEPPEPSSVRSVLTGCREGPVGKNLLQFAQEKHLQVSTCLGHLWVWLQSRGKNNKHEPIESILSNRNTSCQCPLYHRLFKVLWFKANQLQISQLWHDFVVLALQLDSNLANLFTKKYNFFKVAGSQQFLKTSY